METKYDWSGEFDEWFKSLNEGGRTTYFLGQEGNISKEAWDFQQVKIDELQVRLDGANERALSILNHKNVMVDKCKPRLMGCKVGLMGWLVCWKQVLTLARKTLLIF